MNMKKTIAALAAGAVAVSAMATTVSALEDTTLIYNLSKHVRITDGTVDITGTIANVQGGTDIKVGLTTLPAGYNVKKLSVVFKDTAGGAGSKVFDFANSWGSDNFDTSWYVQEVTIPAASLAEGSYDMTVVATTEHEDYEWGGSTTEVSQALDAAGTLVYAEFTGSTTTVTEGEDTIYRVDDELTAAQYEALASADKLNVDVVDTYTVTEAITNTTTLFTAGSAITDVEYAALTTEQQALVGGIAGNYYATADITETTTVHAANATIDKATYDALAAADQAKVTKTTAYTVNTAFVVEGEDTETTTPNAEPTKLTNKVKASNYKNSTGDDVYPFKTDVKNNTEIIGYLENAANNLQNASKPGDYKSYVNVRAVLNDAIENYESVTFTFNTAIEKINGDGKYDSNGSIDCRSFAQHLYTTKYDPEGTQMVGFDWAGYNLFQGALIVNEGITMSLAETDYFDWTATSLSFGWDAIMDGAMTENDYALYLRSMKLATSNTWYWDSLTVECVAGADEDASSDAGVDGDGAEIDDEPAADDTVEEPADEPAEEPADEPAEEPAPEVANPTTGNASVALAVIPVALAAAAVVAKKRS